MFVYRPGNDESKAESLEVHRSPIEFGEVAPKGPINPYAFYFCLDINIYFVAMRSMFHNE